MRIKGEKSITDEALGDPADYFRKEKVILSI